MIIAHIMGIPVEESVLALAPAGGGNRHDSRDRRQVDARPTTTPSPSLAAERTPARTE